MHGDAIKVALQAVPMGGEANAALLRFLCDFFDIPRHNAHIVSGHHSRRKTVEILGVAPVDISRTLLATLEKSR